MDGDVATKRIRLIEECSGKERHLPIVAVTARALPDEVEHIKLSGVDEVLTKPVSEQDLERVIHAYTGTSIHQASAYKPHRSIGNTLRSLVSELSLDDSPPLVDHQDVGHLIDIEELFARSGMSLQNTRRILESFLISFGDIRSVLEHRVEMGDNRATLRGLHSLRGLLLDVGARSATSIVEEREERWRGMDEHSISSDELTQLFAALEPVLSLTQRLIQELPIQTEDFLQ
jgi:CheY-like chemotaxis protein